MNISTFTLVLGVFVLFALVRPASAQQVTGDCEGWIETAQWPQRGAFVRVEATLEELQGGVFVAIDTSLASAFAPNGGEVLIASPFPFTLQPGTYRLRTLRTTYDSATSTPSAASLAAWPAADTHALATISSEFACSSGRPEFTISAPPTATRGQALSIQPTLSSASSWPNTLRYTLASAPSSMSIDQTSGTITWIPTPSDVGRKSVIVALESDGEILDLEGFEISVVGP